MLFHDLNPQLIYVSQSAQRVYQLDLKELQVKQRFRIRLDNITNLFKSKQPQVACCATVCC